jgi:hypothetical protein
MSRLVPPPVRRPGGRQRGSRGHVTYPRAKPEALRWELPKAAELWPLTSGLVSHLKVARLSEFQLLLSAVLLLLVADLLANDHLVAPDDRAEIPPCLKVLPNEVRLWSNNVRAFSPLCTR